jgi:hypothetical protein
MMVSSFAQHEPNERICDVCGIWGPVDRWYKEPRYDCFGKLLNEPYGERGVVGHREKIIYIPNSYGDFHHLSMCCCSECHTIVVDLNSRKSVFETREKFYEYIEKCMKFRAMAKNTSSNSLLGIVLYTHYNRNFEKGLIVKIPGSDAPATKNDVRKLSKFRYFIVTRVYSNEIQPTWASQNGYSSKSSFDYYVEVMPYDITRQKAYDTIVVWWKRVRSRQLDYLEKELETTQTR